MSRRLFSANSLQRFTSQSNRLAVEKRLLFDGAGFITAEAAVDTFTVDHADNPAYSPEAEIDSSQELLSALIDKFQQDLYVIDQSLPDISTLLESLPTDASVLFISDSESGVSAVSNFLASKDDVGSLHIVTHANADGSLQLGRDTLTQDSIQNTFSQFISEWSNALSEDADLLLYGCNLAESQDGIETLNALSQLLAVDIAASTDVTGVDGDWQLEHTIGSIESVTFVADKWQHNLLLNTPPVAVADIATVAEDTANNTIHVLANDTDLNGDDLSVTGASALFGTVTINPDNTLSYTPNENFFGVDTITYTIQDEHGASALLPGEVVVTVNNVNDLPFLLLPDLPILTEDTPLIFAELYGTSLSVGDIDGSVAEVTLSVPVGCLTLSQTAGLTLSQGDGVDDNQITFSGDIADINAALNGLIYTPDADYNGPVTLTIGLTDTLLSLPITTVLPITIDAVVDITDDSVTMNVDEAASFNVMANDTFENALAQVTSFSTPLHGSLTLDAQGNAIYTPNAGYSGTDSFTYTVTSSGIDETATVYLNVVEPNVIPQISLPVSETLTEDSSLIFSAATGNAITVNDLNGDTLTVTISATHAEISLSQNTGLSFSSGDGLQDDVMVFSGTIADINVALDGLIYNSNADFYGNAILSLNVSDGQAQVTGGIAVAVAGETDGVSDQIVTDVGQIITFDPLANDQFESSAEIVSVQGAAHGEVTLNIDGTVTYSPDAGYRGTDQFTYSVFAGDSIETVQVDMTVGINNAPTVLGLGVLNANDGDLINLSVAAGFLDGDLLDVLTYTAVGLPDGLTLDPSTGLISGVLDADASAQVESGHYNVTVTATDILGASADFALDINVANLSPIVSAAVSVGLEDTALGIDALVNAVDPDGDDISIIAATALNGTVSILPDGTLNYVPDTHFNGVDTITYTVQDSDGASSVGSIAVTVTAVADLPTISIPTLDLLTEDTPLIFANLLGQQISVGDVDGAVLDLKLSVPLGSLTLTQTAGLDISEGDGVDDQVLRVSGSAADINAALNNLIYTPGEDYNGPVDITVELGQLGQLLEVNAIVPIGISAVVDIVDDTINLVQDQTITTNVMANDTFENAGAVVDSYTTPLYGTLTLDASGALSYTPNTGFTGTDTFTYTVESNGTYETATVTLHIQEPPNAVPVAVGETATVAEDTALVVDVLLNDSDADGDALSVTAATASNGSVSINPDGTLTYVPNPNYNGPDTITYTISDGQGGTASASVAVTVNPVNDDPIAVADSVTTDEDASITVDVLANDSDVEGDSLTVISATADNGALSINPDGSVTYTPNQDFYGTDTVVYIISDGNGGTSTTTMTVTVNAVNDAPDAQNDTAVTAEDTTVNIDILANDSDAEGDVLGVSAASAGNGVATIEANGTITYKPNATSIRSKF